jgi:hypothetical protein
MLSGAAGATTLTAKTNIDNGYQMFLSTDDSLAGTQFGAGENWPTTFTDTATLVAGVTNYLHIFAYDQGGIAGLLGEFTLSDAGFAFANGLQTLLSGEAGLQVSTTGWSGYGATTGLGSNGVGPWGYQGAVSPMAQWVWSANAYDDNAVYFTAAITSVAPPVSAVPLPAGLPLMLAALGGLGMVARRRKAA